MWKYYAMRFAMLVIAPLPERIGLLITSFSADLSYMFARKTRRVISANVAQTLGPDASDKEVHQTVRQVFHCLAGNYYDLLRLPRCSSETIERRLTIHGLEHMGEAWKRGKGVIIATAHLGNFDLLAQAAALHNTEFTVIVEPLKPKKMFDLIVSLRRSKGLRFVPADASGIRAAFRALKNGEAVGIASDRAIKGGGVMVKFMEKEALLPVGAVELASRTGATVVPAFGVRVAHDKYEIHMEPGIVFPENIDGEAVRSGVARLAKIMEVYIRKHPGQWVVTSPVWDAGTSGTEEGVRSSLA